MNGNGKHIFVFGPYHLDTAEHLLTLNEQIVPLAPKVIDTLSILVENRGRVLSKDELMQSLWPDTFVEESNLTQNISQIRRALNEGSPEVKYIETIPKRGYRFTAEVLDIHGPNGHAFEELFLEPVADINIEEPHQNIETNHLWEKDGVVRDSGKLAGVTIEPPSNINSKSRYAFVITLMSSVIILVSALYIAWNKTSASYEALLNNPQFVKLTNSGKALLSTVSNDGKYIAYTIFDGDRQSLHISQIEAGNALQITTPEEINFVSLEFSPDDQYIYYVAIRPGERKGDLYRMPFLGGVSNKIKSGVSNGITISPDGLSVAFARQEQGSTDTSIIIASLDGSGERVLATRKRPTVFSLDSVAWSPNGKYLACIMMNIAGSETTERIALINIINGEQLPPLNGEWSNIGKLAWLPDSNGLVFNAWIKESGVFDDPLWLINVSTNEAKRLTNENTTYTGIDTSLKNNIVTTIRADRVSKISISTITPTGFKEVEKSEIQSGFSSYFNEYLGLAWASNEKLLYASQLSGNIDIWISDRKGENQTQLTSEARADNFPVITKDGRYIVFVSQRGAHSNIWRIDANGKNPRQLTNGIGDIFPSVTSDGKTVVYGSWTNNTYHLWKVSIEGGQPVKISDRQLFRPDVSPDGKWISSLTQSETGIGFDLAILPIEGGEIKILEKGLAPSTIFVKWFPDGKSLTYIRTVNGVSNIWSKPVDGRDATPLTSFTSDKIFRFAWSPDGRQLACERGININDVIIIR